MRDKHAAEKLQGYWILEIGELAGIRKIDEETLKSFYQGKTISLEQAMDTQ